MLDTLDYWDESVWLLMVESEIVYRDKRIMFRFYKYLTDNC